MRFILIDRHSGYIMVDVRAATPEAAAQHLDRQVHDPVRHYEPTHGYDAAASYDVYIPPADFPEIDDGQDAAMIEQVQHRCTYIGSLKSCSLDTE